MNKFAQQHETAQAVAVSSATAQGDLSIQVKGNSTARIIPGGKVYRQLFEAQVQLNETAEKVKEKYSQFPPLVKVTQDNIPLLNTHDRRGYVDADAEHWIDAPSNELYVQNPVFYKYKTEETQNVKPTVSLRLTEKLDVTQLPDTVYAASKDSDIETRLNNTRRKKHNEVWEDMVQEVGMLNISMEQEIRKIGNEYLKKVSEDDEQIKQLLSELENYDSIIVNGTYDKFQDLKKRYLTHSDMRKTLTDSMDEQYAEMEGRRIETIRAIFEKYAPKIFRINFFSKSQLEKLMDDEILQLNGHILMNKMFYANLYAKLVTADMERERVQMERINTSLKVWQNYALELEIKRLSDFIENLDILKQSPHHADYQAKIEAEQKTINSHRLELVDALHKFKPPESNKTTVYKWHDSITKHTRHIDTINMDYIGKIHEINANANAEIIKKIEDTLEYLIACKIINKGESKEMLRQKLLPIWNSKQRQIDDYIESIEQNLDQVGQLMSREIDGLFKFLQGLSHIWDLHEIGLVKKERSLQELLQDCRRDHDSDNQKREEKLDTILDQMREASSEKDLKRLMANVSLQLEAIRRGYVGFKDAQLELIRQYPHMIKDELKAYEESLYNFLTIVPESKLPGNEQQQQPPQQTSRKGTQETVDSLRYILKEVLSSERGTKFYIKINPNHQPELNEEFEDKSQVGSFYRERQVDSEDMSSQFYLKNSIIPSSVFREIKDAVRLSFVNHLEAWLRDAENRSNSLVIAKIDEVDKELELRLHLHEPRSKRAEMDIHNVRAVELLMHEERIERHCAGVEQVIEQMQRQYEELQDTLRDMGERNRDEMTSLEVLFNSANKSIRLMALHEQLRRQKDKYIEDIKTRLRNFRAQIDETLSMLRNSNAKFRFSFNGFSDGGNFSAEEIEVHKKKLERMSVIIDTNETNMLKEMEKLEKKNLEEAIKLMTQFQDKFKYHLVDLQFIEKISRWLNETQVKIKTHVNESNKYAKDLSTMIVEFERKIDVCDRPNVDNKDSVGASRLLDAYDEINKAIYERALYLNCLNDKDLVPVHLKKQSAISIIDEV